MVAGVLAPRAQSLYSRFAVFNAAQSWRRSVALLAVSSSALEEVWDCVRRVDHVLMPSLRRGEAVLL